MKNILTIAALLVLTVPAAPARTAAGTASAGVSRGGELASARETLAEPTPALRPQHCATPGEACRRISRDEIWRAVQTAVHGGQLPAGIDAVSASLSFHAPWTDSGATVPLEVREASYDGALRQWRFVLASREDPRLLPFLVTLPQDETQSVQTERRPQPFAADASQAPLKASSIAPQPAVRLFPGAVLPSAVNPAEALVQRGKPACLQIFSKSLHMTLQVVPLETGALHQTVRVRVAGGAQILQGEVVAAGQMESRF